MATPLFISPCRLQQMLEEKHNALQIVDCRSFMHYNTDRILTSINVYCPPLLRKRYPSCLPLETIVSKETQKCLLRPNLEAIILHDLDTDEFSSDSTKAELLLTIKSLVRLVGKKNFFILSGGFLRFKRECPRLCVSHSSLFKDRNLLNPQQVLPLPPGRFDRSPRTELSSMGSPVELLPYLYIGDASHSSQRQLLKEVGITAILNVSTSCENHFPEDFRYKVIPVQDTVTADLLTWFTDAINFIENIRLSGGRVLVHCKGGVSRSATICLAYLMYARSLGLDDAFDYVKSRRDVISPNASFMMQLTLFEKEISNHKTPKTPTPPSLSPCRLYTHSMLTSPDHAFTFDGCEVNSASPDVDMAHVQPSFQFLSSPVVSTS
ncbi:dual specificity protein phosphatase 1-A-like [Haliotis asinina]|uniref:dual specificity protein phosphatase 1-A-like n=1 Tax=Haliotis asinina TaxID=109174 RepID=UPI003531D1A4